MIALVLVALLLAIVVGIVWSLTIGAHAAALAALTFIVVLLLGAWSGRGGATLP